CKFIENNIGCWVDNTTIGNALIDSSFFCHNTQVGVRIVSGVVGITNSSFLQNNNFDIENQGTSDISAETNWWEHTTYVETIDTVPNNFSNIFDKSDDPAKGTVSISNPQISLTNFDYNIAGFQVFFNNTTTPIANCLWSFGDNTESTQINPMHTYTEPGYYDVCLEPTNCNENPRGTICKTILIKGLSTLYPNISGNTNTYIGIIHGAGFTPEDVVTLLKPGQPDIVADTIVFIDGAHIKAFFTLENAPLGEWDLLVSGSILNDTLQNALLIKENKPYSFQTYIEGRSRLLINRPENIRIVVKNLSNQTAFGVPVFVSLSAKFKVTPTNAIVSDSIPQAILDSLENGFIKWYNPEINDTLLLGFFVIPVIPSNDFAYIDLTVQSSYIADNIVKVSVFDPMFTAQDYLDNGILYRGNSFGFPDCFACAWGIAGLPGIPTPLGVTVGVEGSMMSAMQAGHEIEEGNYGQATLNVISGVATIISLTATAAALMGTGPVVATAVGVATTASLISTAAGFYTGTPGISGCADCVGDITEFGLDVRSSWDPNEKIGLLNSTEENYFQGNQVMPYTIYFENASTATAPANEVFITDVIDTTVLDINTVEFIGFGFADTIVNFIIPIKDSSFTFDVNLSPVKNIIVRVRGFIDLSTSTINWSFRTFDPITMDLPYDIELGFLNPNITAPEGEGFVKFRISPKENLPNSTVIANDASIVFDYNTPIVTPNWINTIDIVEPESEVLLLNSIQTDTTFTVSWFGNDSESGISSYDIFYSTNGSPYELWLRVPYTINEQLFDGEIGNTYCFYSVSSDNAGNIENAPSVADACTQVTVGMDALPSSKGYLLLQNTPNPFNDETTIGFILPETSQVSLIVTNQLGQKEVILDGMFNAGHHNINYTPKTNTSNLSFYTLTTPKYTKTLKMIKYK
ncbi:MAG TPA: PKD domain-containing protein, partial [Chitinophagales bacterium]|nr:PKD domain-containing protein [Chitinophagales bacterium]